MWFLGNQTSNHMLFFLMWISNPVQNLQFPGCLCWSRTSFNGSTLWAVWRVHGMEFVHIEARNDRFQTRDPRELEVRLVEIWWNMTLSRLSRWWFQISLHGEPIQFDYYISNGLKPPTSYVVFLPFLLEVNLESHWAYRIAWKYIWTSRKVKRQKKDLKETWW